MNGILIFMRYLSMITNLQALLHILSIFLHFGLTTITFQGICQKWTSQYSSHLFLHWCTTTISREPFPLAMSINLPRVWLLFMKTIFVENFHQLQRMILILAIRNISFTTTISAVILLFLQLDRVAKWKWNEASFHTHPLYWLEICFSIRGTRLGYHKVKPIINLSLHTNLIIGDMWFIIA